MSFNTVKSLFAIIISIQALLHFVQAEDEGDNLRHLRALRGKELTTSEITTSHREPADHETKIIMSEEDWYTCETCNTQTRLLQESSSKKGDADTPKATDTDKKCYTYLCIYSSVAEDVKMTNALQECYGEEYPGMTAGHAAIMLVDTCTDPPTITTYGNWPDSVVDNGDGSDIRVNYCGDIWTKEKYPFVSDFQLYLLVTS